MFLATRGLNACSVEKHQLLHNFRLPGAIGAHLCDLSEPVKVDRASFVQEHRNLLHLGTDTTV
jgi:hypothetical protein